MDVNLNYLQTQNRDEVFFRLIAAASPAVTDADGEDAPIIYPPGEPMAVGDIGLRCAVAYG